jgi:hypothetical protein
MILADQAKVGVEEVDIRITLVIGCRDVPNGRAITLLVMMCKLGLHALIVRLEAKHVGCKRHVILSK